MTPAQNELEPGGETTLDLVLKDADGQPVADAELAVVVVDEAILALTNYQLADPLETFYADRPLDLMSVYARSSIVLANPQALAQGGPAATTAAAKRHPDAASAQRLVRPAAAPAMERWKGGRRDERCSRPAQPIRLRTDFNPLAIFAPAVRTMRTARPGRGEAARQPDPLPGHGRCGGQRGQPVRHGRSQPGRPPAAHGPALGAALPQLRRPSSSCRSCCRTRPTSRMEVDVAVRASNLELTGDALAPAAAGVRVTVPARDRVEVRFPAAALLAGTCPLPGGRRFGQLRRRGDRRAAGLHPGDHRGLRHLRRDRPGAVSQPVAAPQGRLPPVRRAGDPTSSTALQALTDAVLYLVSYPYECTEQIASRILAIAALRDVLTAFNADGMPSPEAMQASVQQDIETLQGLQNDDGGFPYWRRGQESIPFNTIHTAHALIRAGSKGFSVPADMQQRALEYLRQIESHYPS